MHDPYGGTGERLGAMADSLGLTFSGTEIEQSFIVDPRVVHGDATDPTTYPTRSTHGRWWICTSPTYANGVADDFKASDSSKRKTYRQAIATIEGADRKLHPNNMGRYGYRGTKRDGRSSKRIAFWDIAASSVVNWDGAERVLLNVSDFVVGTDDDGNDIIEPFVEDWLMLLERYDWYPVSSTPITTPRYKNGSDESRDKRVLNEMVICLEQR